MCVCVSVFLFIFVEIEAEVGSDTYCPVAHYHLTHYLLTHLGVEATSGREKSPRAVSRRLLVLAQL